MKTAISIPDPLFEAADKLAGRLGVSRSELYQRAVRGFLEQYGRDVIREKLDGVYGPDEGDPGLDSAIEYLQNESLRGDDW
jgi:hypothetical protein